MKETPGGLALSVLPSLLFAWIEGSWSWRTAVVAALSWIVVFMAVLLVKLPQVPYRLAKENALRIAAFETRPDADLRLFFDPGHPVCVQHGVFSLSEYRIIRVGIINVSNHRRQKVKVLFHDIQPSLEAIGHIDIHRGVKQYYQSTGHLHHACPLKDTSPTIEDKTPVIEFDVDPSPPGLLPSPTAYVDVVLQATDEHFQFRARLLCCPPEVTHHYPEVVSTRLPANTETVLVLRLSSDEVAPSLRLHFRPAERGEFLVTAL